MWWYSDKEFTEDMIDEYVGFVYCITNTENNRKYIGKKLFRSTRKAPPLKGKKRRRTIVKQSDWQSYYGSSEEVKFLVEEIGNEKFHREIIHLCKFKGEMSYLELKEQVERKVLFDETYYNEFIGCKIHSKHVKGMRDEL